MSSFDIVMRDESAGVKRQSKIRISDTENDAPLSSKTCHFTGSSKDHEEYMHQEKTSKSFLGNCPPPLLAQILILETKPFFCTVLNILTTSEPNTRLYSAQLSSATEQLSSRAVKALICNYTAFNNGRISITPHLQFCQKPGLPPHTGSDHIPAYPHPQLTEADGQHSIMLTQSLLIDYATQKNQITTYSIVLMNIIMLEQKKMEGRETVMKNGSCLSRNSCLCLPHTLLF